MSVKNNVFINTSQDIKLKINKISINLEGPLGSLVLILPKNIFIKEISKNNYELAIININKKKTKTEKQQLNQFKSLIYQTIKGISQGFFIKLNITGLGYKASIENSNLILLLGYTHSISINIPSNMKITCPKPNTINIFGTNYHQITQFADKIRTYKKIEPYKGKGIKYKGEIVKFKEGKKKS